MEGMEIEARFADLDHAEIEQKLVAAGARRTRNSFFREWVFALPEWRKDHRRVRVRTDGTTTWLTYKANKTWAVDSTEEIEVEVSSADDASELIRAIGIPLERYQEKKRISYGIGDIIFDLDTWPKIPPVLEIEAPSEEKVKEGAALLGLDWKDAIFIDQKVLHRERYGVDLDDIAEYRFDPAPGA